MSIFNRCSNVSRATFRMAPWDILANRAFRSSPKAVVSTRAAPSTDQHPSLQYLLSYTWPHPSIIRTVIPSDWLFRLQRCIVKKDVHPAILAPANIHTLLSAVIGTFKLSTTSLKKNGTCTLRTLPATSKPKAPTTRTLVLLEPFGHMLVASCRMMRQSAAL